MAITQIDKIIYTAQAHTTGGRDGGSSRTSDGSLDVKLAVPGTHGIGTNPEQLLAVGWSAYFLSAMKIVAARLKLKLSPDVAVDPEVDLGTTDGHYFIQARLNHHTVREAPPRAGTSSRLHRCASEPNPSARVKLAARRCTGKGRTALFGSSL